MECNRDEAKRAKEIAERKYCSKDITGAKKFALKAQSLYPDLDGISQFLATLDVYAAAENKINGESDLYGILGVSPLADDDTVKKHYRKLALSLHPDKNKSVGAEGAFQFVSEAWTVLSDKEKRSVYDRKTNVTMQKFHAQNRVPKPPTNNGFHKFTTAQTRVKSTKAKGTTNSPKDGSIKLETFLGRTGTGRTETGTGGSKTAGAGPTTTGSKDDVNATTKTETRHTGTGSGPVKTGPKKAGAGPTTTGSKDDINATTKTETSHAGTGSGPVKTGPKKAGAGPTKSASAGVRSSSNKQMTPKTFWTVCKRCKLQYEFLRKYLNQALLCPTCHGPFHATAIAPPNTNGSSESAKGSDKTVSNPETCETSVVDPGGQFSSMNGLGGVKRDREESGIGEEALRRKISKVAPETKQDNHENNKRAPTEVKKDVVNPRIIKDGLIKKATMEIKKKLNEWNSETVCGNSLVADLAGGTKPLVTNDVPDADFHDFDRDRRRKCFAEGQLWGGYDEHDGMPRLYAMVKKVISLKPFRMKVRWFDPKPDDKNLGLVSRFLKTAAFGEFKPGKHEIVSTPNYFSHKANFKKQATGTIYVFPRKGDVCALYRNYQTSDSDLAESNYEIVEVDDYDEETGATVTPLIKVSGFKTVFHRHLDAKETRVVEKNEMFMFSHQIPSFLLTGKEAARSPKGCVELDPAAVPPQFLQLNGEAAVEDDEMLELGKGTAGADGKIFIID